MTVITTKPVKQSIHNHLVIRASAGTGKTFQLSSRFLQLVLSGQPADHILATTFTRKAAGEILERVMSRLASAATSEARCQQLAEELQRPQLTCRQCRITLRQLTRDLHRLRISTLDAFFLQATQSLSLELGLPPTSQIADEHEELLLRDLAISEFIESEDHQTIIQLTHWLTKGEARRGIHDLLRDTISESYDLFVETSKTAWHTLTRQPTLSDQELRETIAQLDQTSASGRIQQAIADDLRRIDKGDWKNLIKKGIASKVARGDNKYYRIDIPHEVIPAYHRLIAHAVAQQRNQIVMQNESTYEVLSRFHKHFEAVKLSRRLLLFNDLAKNLTNLQHAAHLQHLAFRLDASIESLLLDEFQDTSLSQWQVIRPFAEHTTREAQGSFLCVGDQKQAIYGWRGGNAELLDAVVDELSPTSDLTLDTSYRSSVPVIETVNQLNQNLDAHPNLSRAESAVSQWVERFPKHETARADLPGYVTLHTARAASEGENQTQVTLRCAVDRIREIVRQSPHISVAVLVRTNESVGRCIFELHRAGIPASEEGGNPLVDSAAVQLVLSLVTLADHPGDTVARYHLSRSPWRQTLGLDDHTSDTQADRLARAVRESLADQGYGPSLLTWARQLEPYCDKREWRRLGQLVELGYLYQSDIERPRTIGQRQQSRVSMRCDAFVDYVHNQRVADPSEDPVRVMTIHQAKGLQFDFVVLPDLDRNLFGQSPRCVVHRPAATQEIDLACCYAEEDLRQFLPARYRQMFDSYFSAKAREELCVLYVAMTRAKHAMQMVVAPSRKSENRMPLTSAGLIRAALTEGQSLAEEQLVYESGQQDWQQQLKPVSATTKSPPRKATSVQLASRKPHTTRSQTVVQPSSMEGGGRVRLADRLTVPNATAMQLGELIHAFFEQVQWLDLTPPTDDQLVEVVRGMDADEQHIQQSLERFHGMISRSDIRRLLSQSSYADRLRTVDGRQLELSVCCEQTVMVSDEERLMCGSIDRLVLINDGQIPIGADIIDFKTDGIRNADDLTARVTHYRPQLEAYARGVQRMLQIRADQITTRLVFLADGQIVEV